MRIANPQFPTALLAAVLLAGGTASAAAPTQEPQWLGSKAISYDVELRYESESSERTEKETGAKMRFSNLTLSEIINLHWSGFVYHPRFLRLTTTFGFNVQQIRADLEEPGLTRHTRKNTISPQYQIRGVFLPEHPFSLAFALDQRRSSLASGFGQIATVDTKSERADLFYKGQPLAGRAFASRSQTTQEQLGVGENRDDTILTRGLSLTHTLPRSLTNFSYEFTDTTENVTNAGDTATRFFSHRKTHDVSLDNQLRLDSAGTNTLNSRVSYRKEIGDLASTRRAVEERLHLTHFRNLTSDYSVRHSEDTVGPSQVELTAEQISLSHRLFGSLSTVLEGHASQETFDGSSRDIQGASVNFGYRKRIPHGTLLVNAGVADERTQESGSGGTRPVLDESHVLSDVTTTFLNNVGINLGSVVVMNPAKTITYLRDIDYRLIQSGGLVEIRRLPTGAIPDGGTVLVSYTFETGGPFAFETRNTHARVDVDLFDRLKLYAGVRDSKQTLLSGVDDGRLQDLRDTVYGTTIRWGPTTATAEHQIYDSSLTPYTSDRAQLDYNKALGQFQSLVASASWRHVAYGTGGQSTFKNVTGSYRLTYPRGPSLNLSAGHEQQDDRGFAGTFNYARIEASYRYRATDFSLSARLNERDDTFARERSTYILFTIKRTF